MIRNLTFVDHHYTKANPTLYAYLEAPGGSEQILWIVRRGLKAREEDFDERRPPMRFSD